MNRARLLIRTGGPKDDEEDMGPAVWAVRIRKTREKVRHNRAKPTAFPPHRSTNVSPPATLHNNRYAMRSA